MPEFFAKPSPYTEGTTFLGTPPNHDELTKKRPLSPDVFEIDGKSMHYKFPWGALSSVTNRVTGVALSAGALRACARFLFSLSSRERARAGRLCVFLAT
jgi:succinate dehydrogenase (ubiquinone) cytochrome b560 subunit